ncbi:MAG: DUF2318 domain-containing protein [Synergistaceae bacterium]|nr:DUF2318 domain-containing protein [Synergistaceae bacterium]
MLGVIFSFSRKKFVVLASLLGIIAGVIVFCVRLYDPKGMNLILLAFNRRVVISLALISVSVLIFTGLTAIIRKKFIWLMNLVLLSIMIFAAFMYLLPPILQFTREFIYFGEAGISTNAMLRALGYTLGIILCLLITLGGYEVHKSLNTASQSYLFMILSILIFALEYIASAVVALQKLKLLKISDSFMNISVFDVMIWHNANPNAFLFCELALAVIMLVFVIITHLRPSHEFPNKALLRKEKARLRDCRRWSMSLAIFGMLAIFTVTVLHYYDNKPPVEIQPEPYEISNGVISIKLENISDGHLHKFSYMTPNGYDVRFLAVKKPAGTAYGIGLDACEICGIAGYFERGDEEVVCKRCDVVMNKNTIGFKGGCNPIPFEYEIKDGKIFIDVKVLEAHENRFR